MFVPTSFFPPDGYEREQLRFDSVSIDSGGAAALGFSFPTYPAVVDGQDFAGNVGACTWFPSTGSCFSLMAPFGSFSGTFDGSTLSLTGTDYAGDVIFPTTFSFTVVAQVAEQASVPAPATLACLGAAVLGMGAARRRGSSARQRRPDTPNSRRSSS